MLESCRALYASSVEPKLGQPVGASEAEVTSLERRLGQRLPAAYREYLTWMGRDVHGIFRGSNWFISDLESNKDTLRGLLEEIGSHYVVAPTHLVFFAHQGYMAAWFDFTQGEADPECWYIDDGMKEPAIKGKFTRVLFADLEGLSSCL